MSSDPIVEYGTGHISMERFPLLGEEPNGKNFNYRCEE